MKSLFEIADRHTFATGVVSASSGLFAWLLNMLHSAAGVAGDLSVLFAAGASVLTFFLLLHKAWIIIHCYRRHGVWRLREYAPFDDELP